MSKVIDPELQDLGKKVGLQVWRVNKFKLEVVPSTCWGVLYTGDAYVILSTKSLDEWDVHFWLGKEATQDEIGVAAIKAVEIDNHLGGFPVQHREIQFHESPLFLSYFPQGIRYVAGGYDSGYFHIGDEFEGWNPKLFHCKGKRNIRCTEVKCKKESLNLGDVFILDLGKDIYCWMPPDSGRLERIRGMERAKNIADVERHGVALVHVLDEDWKTDGKFWSYFGGREAVRSVAKAANDDENYWKKHTQNITLWRVSDASGVMKVTKVKSNGELTQKDLDSSDAFILDAVAGGIFVWVGKGCTIEERGKALIWGENYIDQQKLPYWTRVTRVLEQSEPAAFTQWFSDWHSEKKKKTFEPNLYQVSDESGKIVIEEIANFTQEDLDGDDVMILDALHSIYVWVGTGANENEKKQAESNAKKFLENSKVPRHKKTSIDTIFQGSETPTFKKFFPKWDDKLFKSVSGIWWLIERNARSVANMRKLLFK